MAVKLIFHVSCLLGKFLHARIIEEYWPELKLVLFLLYFRVMKAERDVLYLADLQEKCKRYVHGKCYHQILKH